VFVHDAFRLRLHGVPAHPHPISFTADHASPSQVGRAAVVLLSCSGTDGLQLDSGATLYLTIDPCTASGWLSCATSSA
jgi:hypothetical protein